MVKKKKSISLNKCLKLKNEIIVDTINEIFRNHPNDFASELEKFGFEYHEEEDFEAIEESTAKPENQNQQDLIDYFENGKEVSEKIFEIYLIEKCADHPNYQLLRRYFKEANQNLKALLLYGLNHYPGRIDLLSDLAFFHEFENILTILITYYTSACLMQENLETFTALVEDFYYGTVTDGYNALYALRDLFPSGTEKRAIIDLLIEAKAEDEEECKPDLH
ncbi:MAG: hypothetical protein ABFD75_16180 [Smithella sp.]